ncbi:uncharacterized protein PV07_02395 [Cladophialophora immunda]|uniref:Uncharacterized protein n=1 Tax=Cladophialophora immunda TaxID=569365 RepID=A0A0D2CXA3_9EURO|nr:uncharacterized protein PV07_02395 [Cladophialophora immunda]KIW35713.1 hypothetical protein PV07_02395 [Cladophialophora immunda]OQV05014.1 hypothetical protein CLAIMM_09818 [Cladophialophora immunda]
MVWRKSNLIMFALGGFIAHSYAHLISPATPTQDIIHCGSSIDKARSLGCHFDIMSYAYYPDACWDPHLHDSFVHKYRRQWEWSTLDNETLTVDQVLTGNYSHLRAKSDFHQLHCVYEWQRLIRSLSFGRPLDFKDGDFGHAHHCSMGLLQPQTKDVSDGGPTYLELIVWFARCGMTADQMIEKSGPDIL